METLVPQTNIKSLMISRGVEISANKEFAQIITSRSNFEVLIEIVSIVELSKKIVDELEKIEQGWDFHKDLVPNYIKSLSEEYPIIISPAEPSDAKRWANLIALSAAIIHEFSYGNIIIPSEDIDRNIEEKF